jgi:trehalose synthase
MAQFRITKIEDYETFVGAEVVQRIRDKADKLKGLRTANFNSTYYGGGVAETISSLTLLMNGLGLRTEWRVIQGTPDFFSITKKMHNALQGGEIDLSRIKKGIFKQVIYENSLRNFLDHDFIIVHDPQPLPLIEHYEKKCPWLWRCHLDLSRPDKEMWKYLRRWIDNYDAVILSCKEFAQEMKPPRRMMMPAIDPFTIKNRYLSDREIEERLTHYEIPTDLPLVVQISRFDPWKDPKGVVEAFKLARKQIDARLVLLGNFATDDPEGEEIFHSLCACRDERALILTRAMTRPW